MCLNYPKFDPSLIPWKEDGTIDGWKVVYKDKDDGSLNSVVFLNINGVAA